MEFQEWVTQADIGIFRFDEGNIIGMGQDFIKVFKKIIAYLRKLHHSIQWSGNLRESIRIENRNEVRFVGDINLPFSNPVDGMIDDCRSLKVMVRDAVSRAMGRVEVRYRQFPDVVKMLLDPLYDQFSCQMTLNDFNKKAYFIYNNPIFFDALDTYRFVRKVNEFRKRNVKDFGRIVLMIGVNARNTRETDMTNWHYKIPNHPNPLHRVLHYRNMFQSCYFMPNGIIPYLRNAPEHAQDYVPHLHLDQVEGQLFFIFPDSCAKICYEIVHFLHNDENLCSRLFGCTLMESFQRGSLGFKCGY